jgi:N-acetylglutamate synthase-like GNAT family acetyltransferase
VAEPPDGDKRAKSAAYARAARIVAELMRGSAAAAKLSAHPIPVGARGALSRALVKAGLATDDLDEAGRLFWRFETEDQTPIGFGGLEVHGREALLRSLLVLPPARNRGHGAAIVAALETEAYAAGCRNVWIASRTAEAYFDRLGYAMRARAEVPAAIAAASQFRSLGADGTVMVKPLR